MQYQKYWDAVKGNPEKTKELIEIVDEMRKCLKYACPAEYWHYLMKMHCVVYGPHFDEHTAKKAVAEMHNVDETTGEHWTMDQTNTLAAQNNIKYPTDMYYVMNMLYSDYSKVLGSNVSTYVNMAKAYMNDPDGVHGKAFLTWLSMKNYKEG